MDFPQHPFWDFSVAAHGHAGVHEACLQLQVSHGLDVNLIFFCCWAAAIGAGVMEKKLLAKAMEAVKDWQAEIVRPIWRVRRQLKPKFAEFPPEMTEPLRRSLIKAELDAEHLEQLQLAGAADLGPIHPAPESLAVVDAVDNIRIYLQLQLVGQVSPPAGRMVPVFIPADVGPPIATIVGACFPRLEPAAVYGLVDRHVLGDGKNI